MKIFLTGGTGFIGNHFLRVCADAGINVTALHRSNVSLLALPGIRWVSGSVHDVDPDMLDGIDVVVHLASAGVSPKTATWGELMQQNVLGAIHLAEAARDAGVRRIVCAGTYAEYGRSAERFDPIPADAPLEPTFGYAASKAAAFVALHGFAVEHAMELAYLRIFSAYGEGQHEKNFWPLLRSAALAGEDFEMTPGGQVRDYIAVEEVANAFMKFSIRGDLLSGQPKVVNIATGMPVSMREFAERWWKNFGATGKLKVGALPYRKNEVMRYVPSVEEPK